MNFATDIITGPSISDAWMNAVRTVVGLPGRTAYHLVTRIPYPTKEQPKIRTAAELLSSELSYPGIETVANTIFPERLAHSCRDHHELGRRYRAMYPTIRNLLHINRNGTYFGRLVSYPTASGSDFDQLADTIRKLQVEQSTRGPKSARYELNLEHVGTDHATAEDPVDEAEDGPLLGSPGAAGHTGETALPAAPIYVSGQDRSPMGFPCLSFCSFQLDHGHLHLMAHYRRQELVRRGYGNYLGLARLLRYVSDAVDVEPGQLTIVAGVAAADAARFRVLRLTEQAGQSRVETTDVASM